MYVRMTDTRYWLRAVWLDAADVARIEDAFREHAGEDFGEDA